MSQRSIIIAGAVAALAAAAHANIVVNGSFESVVGPPFTWYSVPIGSTDMTGWTVTTDGYGGSGAGIITFAASAGVQAASLGWPNSGGRISQTLPTAAGQSYTLSFYTSDNSSAIPAAIRVYWDGAAVGDFAVSGVGYWTHYTMTVVATGPSTVLSFENNLPYNGLTVGLVDDVDVSPVVPAPGAAAVLGVAVRGLGRRQRRD